MAKNPKLSAQQSADVKKFRADGETLHKAGKHQESVDTLAKADEDTGYLNAFPKRKNAAACRGVLFSHFLKSGRERKTPRVKRCVASTNAPRIPGSHAECPASGTIR